MIKELLNEEVIKLEGIAILNILIDGRNIVSHFLKEGDTLEYIHNCRMLVINNTQTFIHDIKEITQYTTNSYDIHIKNIYKEYR